MNSPEGPRPVSGGCLGCQGLGDGRGLKVFPPKGATKWYPYRQNRRAGNDSPMCPFHCPSVSLNACVYRMRKYGKVRVSKIRPKASRGLSQR